MFSHPFTGRALGVAACFIFLSCTGEPALAAGAAASSGSTQVAVEYKAQKVPEFQLTDYQDELVECSALAAIHTWLGNPFEEAAGFEVRQALARDYWIEISNKYLSLARQASSEADVQKKVGARMRVLAAEWRRLTESHSVAPNWNGWYDLIDRCDSWRPVKPAYAFYSKGRKTADEQGAKANMAMSSQ